MLSWVLAASAVAELAPPGLDGAPRAMMQVSYRLRARGVLVVLTSLTIVCTWVCARRLGRSAGEALVAAAFVATSFQLATHARFIAPDGLAVAWVSAALAGMARHRAAAVPGVGAAVLQAGAAVPGVGAAVLQAGAAVPGVGAAVLQAGAAVSVGPGGAPASLPWSLIASAACIGVAASTKYTAGALLPLVVWLAWRADVDTRTRARAVAVCVAACAAAFVVVTPGALLEPAWFINGLRFQQLVYSQGWQGYTVDGPLAMLRALGGWLAFASLASWWPFAFACFVLALVGARALWRDGATGEGVEHRSRARAIVLAAPLLVLAFLPQRVFISRNFLPLLPVLALCAARGFTVARAALGARVHPRASLALAVLVLGALGANALDAVLAAESVRNRSDDRLRVAVLHAVERHTRENLAGFAPGLLVSPRVRAQLPYPLAIRTESEPSAKTRRVIAYPDELLAEGSWPGTDAFLVEEVIGPREIDWRYAPTWRGAPRVVVMTIDKARAVGASLTFTPGPAPERARMPMELLLRE
jgi:hypothetical protein